MTADELEQAALDALAAGSMAIERIVPGESFTITHHHAPSAPPHGEEVE